MEVSTCRCCLAQGLHKNLSSTYTLCNKTEVYANMLQDCFNIVLAKYPQCSDGICDTCVSSLRAAIVFKQGVLEAEQQLLKQLCEEADEEKCIEVKQEPKYESDDSDDYFLAEVREDLDYKVKLEAEEEDEELGKRPAPAQKRGNKGRVWDVDALVASLSPGSGVKIKTKSVSLQKSRGIANRPLSYNTKTSCDKNKYKDNLTSILKYSNVLPFKTKTLLGYVCAYCESTYPDPDDLRAHTFSHENERLHLKTKHSTDSNVKVDVTDLKCTLCDEKFDNLTVLKDHLIKKHNITIHKDIKDLIMQFKLKKGEVYDCFMCAAKYETFKMLNQHMNRHYKNYVCSKCDSAFSTKRSLVSHKVTHQEGSFKCDHCGKVFSSKSKRQYHEKIHLGARNIRNCPHCDQSFRSYYQRNQHLIKVHNSEAQYKCNICDKTYILKSLLTYHIKKSHLMEQNCQCTECGYRFFSKKALKAHMVKHTDEKNFACSVCNKAYARKYTLKEHMRIHNNDRRFKCEVCAMTFVQKCSLKSHLLSNHGISMAASEIVSIDSVNPAESGTGRHNK